MYSNRDFNKEHEDELTRLRGIEERLELAIKTHEVYIEAMEADPDEFYGVILSKKAALKFTLDILTDIKGESNNGA